MKQCFVIMPYGGDDPEMVRHYEGVYQSIITPAARAAGYDPKRSDIAGEPGNITHDIIRDLAESDIVIADLTSKNPNVLFELGIRHAFRKSGTVHIVDTAHELAFDVRQYRTIKYSKDLAGIPGVVSQITDAIRKREEHPERADNPVHDAIQHLPLSIMMAGDKALQEQLRTTQQALEQLHLENEDLTRRLAELDPSGEAGPLRPVDVDALLDKADAIMRSTGQHALLRLRRAYDSGGSDEFAKELRGVLKSTYLDPNDFMGIVVLCKKQALDDHRRATLEVARQRYPHRDELFEAFVDALDDSPNPADQERGRLMLEERIGIEHGQGGPQLKSTKSAHSLSNAFGLLFNFYRKAGRYEWILSLTEDPPGPVQTLMLRNRAAALVNLGRTEQARQTYEQAMKLDPDDQTIKWFADFLDDEGEFAEAYALFEQAIVADPGDGTNYLALAVHIINRGLYRDSSGQMNGPLPRRARPRVAIPVMQLGLGRDSQRADLIQDAVKVLVRADAVREAEAIAAGNHPEGDFDTSAVDYLASHIQPHVGEP